MRHSHDEWDKGTGLHADDDDVPPHRRRRALTSAHLYRNVFIAVALSAVGLYLVLRQPGPAQPSPEIVTPRPEIAPLPSAPRSPPIAAPAVASAKTLADCIKDGNVIDQSVATCRFGQRQVPREDPAAQGMVSAAYMAKFKAGQQRATRDREQFTESQRVMQWDGKASYQAQWSVVDNQIDSSSVCANHRRGSIEFRECRKGAKVWFREQCRRANDDSAQHRYCSAASGFSPMG